MNQPRVNIIILRLLFSNFVVIFRFFWYIHSFKLIGLSFLLPLGSFFLRFFHKRKKTYKITIINWKCWNDKWICRFIVRWQFFIHKQKIKHIPCLPFLLILLGIEFNSISRFVCILFLLWWFELRPSEIWRQFNAQAIKTNSFRCVDMLSTLLPFPWLANRTHSRQEMLNRNWTMGMPQKRKRRTSKVRRKETLKL